MSVINLKDLIPGLIRNDFELGINASIRLIGDSKSFRSAEANFEPILPYVERLNEKQASELLKVIRKNDQVYDAVRCAREYIPPLLDKYGHLLSEEDLGFFRNICAHYLEE